MDYSLLEDLKCRLNLSRVSKAALAGIAVVLVMVAALTAGRLIEAAAANDFEMVPSSASDAAPTPDEFNSRSETIFVHVSGAVANPGLYEVAKGARVADTIQAAGGLTEEAAPDSVNLARVVDDGEQIRVATQVPSGESGGGVATDAGMQADSAAGMPVNINIATKEQLESLPGVGESTAAKIVADRQANGSFKTIEDLKRVSGIGDKKFESLRDLICV